ncbi:hypothetical protein PHYPSEUDO_002899 [Phytophthora pseudosyringae]|uniref:Uncharacterized protein n=1 Tax=Phytophthora pseudosyringae TaxID=221518 RepID=A0A8T1VST2_9STRA|nr:hypothetical protein PHYPSEUDO_002899 [Phytophthora pseudosyringae]
MLGPTKWSSPPPSHQARLEKVKCIRDGASREKRAKTKARRSANTSGFELKLKEFLYTVQAYLKVKTKNDKMSGVVGLFPHDSEQFDTNSDGEHHEAEYLQQANV